MAGSRPGKVVTCEIGSVARKEEIVLCLYNRGWPCVCLCVCQCDGEHSSNFVSSESTQSTLMTAPRSVCLPLFALSCAGCAPQIAFKFHFKPISNTEGRCQVDQRYSR